MRSVTVRLEDLRTMILNLGFVGENEHRQIRFDSSKMFAEYPTASAAMTVQPPEGDAYPAVIERDGDFVIWTVSDSDLISDGSGELQLAFTVDEVVARTYVGKTKINRSIIPTGEIPSGLDDFLVRASAALTAIPEEISEALDDAMDDITASADTLEPGSAATASYDNETKVLTIGVPKGEKGDQGDPGAGGFSPSASVSKSGNTATITITDKDGTTTAQISDGQDGRDGQDGAPGADGYSPSASVSKSGTTATITITDKTGTTTATVSDGDPTALIDDTAGSGDTDKVWSADKSASVQSDLLSAIDEIEVVFYKTNPGYIASNGSISSPSNSTLEVYTDKIYAEKGFVFDISLTYTQVRGMWLAYGLYNENGEFISRTVPINSNSQKSSAKVTVSDDRAKFISFSYRTYGEAVFSIKSASIGKINQLENERVSNENIYNRFELNKNVKSINHRGFSNEAPENTIPAFKLSRKNGFGLVVTDVRFTSDNVAVLLHDASINRTARNSDGTSISSTVNIQDITYEQALDYDFGVWKNAKYAGTKIPTFAEFLALCRNLGLDAYVEIKAGTESQIQGLVDMLASYGMNNHVTWISDTKRLLGYVKDYKNSERLGFVCATIDASIISTVSELKTSANEVFIDSSHYTSEEIALCKNASIPLEVYGVESVSTITEIDEYVSGFTTNKVVAGYELFKNGEE